MEAPPTHLGIDGLRLAEQKARVQANLLGCEVRRAELREQLKKVDENEEAARIALSDIDGRLSELERKYQEREGRTHG